MNQRCDLSSEPSDLHQKVTMWCEFDSAVGWGKLSNMLEINESDGIIGGEIRLSENYRIFNKGRVCLLSAYLWLAIHKVSFKRYLMGYPLGPHAIWNYAHF